MRWVVWGALGATLSLAGGCSDDEDGSPSTGGSAGNGGSGNSAGNGGSAGSAGTGGATTDASGGSAGAAVGGYLQPCGGDGGFECDPGLTCKQYVWSSLDGGFSQCGRRLCTKPCTGGCPPPAIGCEGDTCEPPECYSP